MRYWSPIAYSSDMSGRWQKRSAPGVREVDGAKAKLHRVPETLLAWVIDRWKLPQVRRAGHTFRYALRKIPAQPTPCSSRRPPRVRNLCEAVSRCDRRALEKSPPRRWHVFMSTVTRHGCQESTILIFSTKPLHHGMVVIGLPYLLAGALSKRAPVVRRAGHRPSPVITPDGRTRTKEPEHVFKGGTLLRSHADRP